jgi:aspartate/methionine/tyrosine aminotransferase
VVVNSFSKYFSMTGWRLGWMVVPPPLVRRIERLSQNLYIAASTISQVAGVLAFDCYAELDAHVARYRRSRDILLEELPRAGIHRLAPADGAFYVYADVSHLTRDSVQFCKDILAQTGVAVTPGVDFDPTRGRSTMRFSYAGAQEHVTEAARRLRGWLARR